MMSPDLPQAFAPSRKLIDQSKVGISRDALRGPAHRTPQSQNPHHPFALSPSKGGTWQRAGLYITAINARQLKLYGPFPFILRRAQNERKVGWAIKPLGELCEVFADGDWIESKDQSTEGIRLIQTGNVGEGVFKDRAEKARYISDETFKRLRCTEIFEGDCLISRLPDPVGRSAILPDTGQRMITAVDCTIVRFDQRQCLPAFFNYYSQSIEYLTTVAKECTGTTRSRISRSNLAQTPIPIPPLSEQHRIVAILDDAFESIATAKANTEKNSQNARTLFESHLQSVFMERSEGWVEKLLGDVCELFQGLCINAKTKHLLIENSSLPLLRIKDLRTNSAEQFVTQTGWPQNAKVEKSDIIYTRTGQIGLVFRGRVGIIHNNCFKVRPKPSLNSDYLYWWLQNPIFRARITALASKAAQPDITHALFKMQPIFLPPCDYQDMAVKLIDVMSGETQRLESLYRQKLTALDALKKSLLHQAFSGQL